MFLQTGFVAPLESFRFAQAGGCFRTHELFKPHPPAERSGDWEGPDLF